MASTPLTLPPFDNLLTQMATFDTITDSGSITGYTTDPGSSTPITWAHSTGTGFNLGGIVGNGKGGIRNNATGSGLYIASYAPSTANYGVGANLHYYSSLENFPQLWVGTSITGASGYCLNIQAVAGHAVLQKVTAGVQSSISATINFTLNTLTSQFFAIYRVVSGSTAAIYWCVDSVWQTPFVDSSSAVTAVGSAGVLLSATSADGTGCAFQDVIFYQPATTPPTGGSALMISPADKGWLNSPGNWDVTNVRARAVNCGAYRSIKLTGVSSSYIWLTFDTTFKLGQLYLAWRIDGGAWLAAPVNNTVPIPWPSSAQHTFEYAFRGGDYNNDSRWSVPFVCLDLTGITTDAGVTTAQPTPAGPAIISYRDSTGEGINIVGDCFGALDQDATRTFMMLLRTSYEVGIVAFSGQALTNTTNSAGTSVPIGGTTWTNLWGNGPAIPTFPFYMFVWGWGQNDTGSSAFQAPMTAIINAAKAANADAAQLVLGDLRGTTTTYESAAATATGATYFRTDNLLSPVIGGTPNANSLDGSHPNVAACVTLGTAIATEIASILPADIVIGSAATIAFGSVVIPVTVTPPAHARYYTVKRNGTTIATNVTSATYTDYLTVTPGVTTMPLYTVVAQNRTYNATASTGIQPFAGGGSSGSGFIMGSLGVGLV